MRKTVVLTPFHEEYLANTVAQVKDLLWAQFEKENKTSLKGVNEFMNRFVAIPCGWWFNNK